MINSSHDRFSVSTDQPMLGSKEQRRKKTSYELVWENDRWLGRKNPQSRAIVSGFWPANTDPNLMTTPLHSLVLANARFLNRNKLLEEVRI